MTDYSKITALYSRLSVGDEDRDGGESNSIQNQKIFLENYARGQHLTNIRHYIDDDESGRFFDRSAYSRMMDDVENGKIGVCIMKDLTRWGRDYLQVGNAMEIFRRNNVRFIAVNNGIDSEKPDTLEFAPFINIMSEWYAKDISKKVKTGIKTKGMSGKPIVTEAPYGYVKDPDKKGHLLIDPETRWIIEKIFDLAVHGRGAASITRILIAEKVPTPGFINFQRDGTFANIYAGAPEEKSYAWTIAQVKSIMKDETYIGHTIHYRETNISFKNKRRVRKPQSEWVRVENTQEPIISEQVFRQVQEQIANRRRKCKDGTTQIFSGLVKCADCGWSLSYGENRQNSSAHAYRKKISFRLSTITVASRTKKDGFSVSLRTVSAPSGNPGPITAQGRSGSPPIASGRRPP